MRGLVRPSHLRSVVYNLMRRMPVASNHVVLESHFGDDFIGSPYWMARTLLAQGRYDHLQLVIVCSQKHRARLRAILGESTRVRFCRKEGFAYLWELARAAYLVNDTTFPPYFSRRDRQHYLNTWHGTPLKAMGRHVQDGMIAQLTNVQRNFLHATHLLAPNPHTERVLLADYMIRGLWSGTIIRAGYPRNDPFNDEAHREVRDSGTHIAFMPTWRGTLSTASAESKKLLDRLSSDLARLDQDLPEDISLWVRLHPLVSGTLSFDTHERVKPFPIDGDPYEFLSTCDALITDYSSVLFDFSESGKPVILYTPDSAEYESERSLIVDLTELPFAKCDTVESLIDHLKSEKLQSMASERAYSSYLKRFAPHRSSKNSELVCDAFFLGQTNAEAHREVPSPSKRLLMLVDGLDMAQVTDPLKSLLHRLAEANWRVWLGTRASQTNDRTVAFLREISPHADFVAMRNVLAGGPVELSALMLRQLLPTGSWLKKTESRVWDKEWKRLFGAAQFTVIWYFGGRDHRLAALLSRAPAHRVASIHDSQTPSRRPNRAEIRTLDLLTSEADWVVLDRPSSETLRQLHIRPRATVFEFDRFAEEALVDRIVDLLAKAEGSALPIRDQQ